MIGSSYQMVVYPSNRGGYSVQGVPIEHGDTALVCAMPEEWRGKDASELSQISGIASLRFCHASEMCIRDSIKIPHRSARAVPVK